jgi:hypothetical protein
MIENCGITNTGIIWLCRMQQLKELCLSTNDVIVDRNSELNEESFAQVLVSLRNLITLHMLLPKVTTLAIPNLKVGDVGAENIANNLPNLTVLDLSL